MYCLCNKLRRRKKASFFFFFFSYKIYLLLLHTVFSKCWATIIFWSLLFLSADCRRFITSFSTTFVCEEKGHTVSSIIFKNIRPYTLFNLVSYLSQTENLPLLTVFSPQLISTPSFCYSHSQRVCVCVFHMLSLFLLVCCFCLEY